MTDAALLLMSIALPWSAGTLAVMYFCRNAQPLSTLPRGSRSQCSWLLAAGYGYPLGAFAVTLVMRALDAAGIRWTLIAVALPIIALIVVLLALIRRSSWQRNADHSIGLERSSAMTVRDGVFWFF